MNQGTDAKSPGGRYANTQRDPMLEQNPMADGDSDYEGRAAALNSNLPAGVGSGKSSMVPPISGIPESEYT